MPTSLDSWWSREALHKGGTPVVVKMEDPNWSVLELDNAASAAAAATTTAAAAAAAGGFDKHRGKNAKQLTWVLLLKAHRAAGCLAWLAHGLWILLAAIKKRLVQKQGIVNSDKPRKGKLHKFITGFLVFAVAMLGFELVAHRSGWHFSAPRLRLPASASGLSLDGLLQGVYLLWIQVRGKYIAPPLQGLANFCIVLFLIQSADRIVLCLGCLWIKYRGIKVAVPDPAAFESGDLEQPGDGRRGELVGRRTAPYRTISPDAIAA